MNEKVVITDDGSSALQKLVLDLEKNGFEVNLVESDGEKLERVIEKSIPDILIADAFMKNRDALEVLSSLGGKLKKCGARIFIKTALKSKRYEKRLLAKGADAYLLKPVELDEVIGKGKPAAKKKSKFAFCFRQAKRV